MEKLEQIIDAVSLMGNGLQTAIHQAREATASRDEVELLEALDSQLNKIFDALVGLNDELHEVKPKNKAQN